MLVGVEVFWLFEVRWDGWDFDCMMFMGCNLLVMFFKFFIVRGDIFGGGGVGGRFFMLFFGGWLILLEMFILLKFIGFDRGNDLLWGLVSMDDLDCFDVFLFFFDLICKGNIFFLEFLRFCLIGCESGLVMCGIFLFLCGEDINVLEDIDYVDDLECGGGGVGGRLDMLLFGIFVDFVGVLLNGIVIFDVELFL